MIRVTELHDMGNDVLRVSGIDNNGEKITAIGWVSAITNHFDNDDGKRIYRPMTPAERNEYTLRLLVEQNTSPKSRII